MHSPAVRILNFDGAVTAQRGFMDRFSPRVVDLREIGPACRVWMGARMEGRIRAVLRPELRSAVTFLGSGDFHHVTKVLLDQFTEPLTLIVADNHPDWYLVPPGLSCGTWVARALENRNINKVILFGVSSRDISTGWIEWARLESLRHDRLEIYAYTHAPTTLFFRRVPDNSSLRVRTKRIGREITWEELKGRDLPDFFRGVLLRLRSRRVYVSVDKDCLRSKCSLTNWEEGRWELDELLGLLELIKRECDIVGCDVCGDYSPVRVRGFVRSLYARLDHPRRYSARGKPERFISAVNESANAQIAAVLLG